MPEVFISYSSKDKAAAGAACAVLEQHGLRCWVAPRDILPGEEWADGILRGIAACRVMVIVFSRHANESPHVRREVERAVARGMTIIPFRIEDVSPTKAMEYFISAAHRMDGFPPPLQIHLEKLAGTILGSLGRARESAPAAAIPAGTASGKQPRRGGKFALIGTLLLAALLLVGGIIWRMKRDKGGRAAQAPQAATATAVSPATATKDTPFVNTLGMKFVPVPGTQALFSVWDTRVVDYAAYARMNKVDGAWMTMQRDGVPVGREPDHPVVGVSWEDAQGFCQWLTEKESAEGKLPKGFKYRLPSDEEWSWAVGLPRELGATPEEKNEKNSVDFPWGKDWPPTGKVGNYADETFHTKFPKDSKYKEKDQPWIAGYDDGYATTSPVGSFPANAYGLYDVGGNVWQWCEDWYDKDHKDRVVRGSPWDGGVRGFLLSSHRFHLASASRYLYIGFRCVLAPSSQASSAVSPPPSPQVSSPPTSAAILERGAIRLFDSPVQFINPMPGIEWVDNALHLKKGGLNWASNRSRDAIVRASIRTNPDAIAPRLSLRFGTPENRERNYNLVLDFQKKLVRLRVMNDGLARELQSWPLPRDYGPDEWVKLELRTIGEEITASLDGAILGTMHDSTVTEPGMVQVTATANSYFRDIDYTPLDKPGAAHLPAATKDAPFVNSRGIKFVPVPGTDVLFSVWDVRMVDYAAYAAVTPKADDSWKTQERDGVPVGREPDHPVVGVSWEDAQAFCRWLTAKETIGGILPPGLRYRLPTDEEWSWAVGLPPEVGATPAEKSGENTVDFPWGKDWPPTTIVGNYADETFHAKFPKDDKDKTKDQPWIEGYTDRFATTSPVGSFPANAYGLYDMGGNVSQWCEDWLNAEHKYRVMRGASFINHSRGSLLSSSRGHAPASFHDNRSGFRCVLAKSAW